MQDIFIDSYGEIDFSIVEDRDAIQSELGVFLSIRATDGYIDGELNYDTNQGLDYDLLLDLSIDDEIKKKYIKKQIFNYYKEIEEIKNINIVTNKSTREIKIDFEYKTIYSQEYKRREVLNNV